MTEKERRRLTNQLVNKRMAHTEDTIGRLEKIAKRAVHRAGEPPFVMRYDDLKTIYDAIELLEEQKPNLVIRDRYGLPYCPRCSTKNSREELFDKLYPEMNYCPYCGQRLLFEYEGQS